MWQGVFHGCYRNSRLLTLFVALMMMKQWKQGIWLRQVDTYITASEFGRQKLIQAGMPPEKIMIKPNFVHSDPGVRENDHGYALYVGRLSEEKGLHVLLKAWESLPEVPLYIMGKGPLEKELKNYVKNKNMKSVKFLGFLDEAKHEEVLKGAKILVIPSQCYENFPRIVAEAFSCGIPVLASRLGSLEEIIREKETGVLFDAQNPSDLIDKVLWMVEHEKEIARIGISARKAYEDDYSTRRNYERLMQIYQNTIGLSKSGSSSSVAADVPIIKNG